MTNEVQEANVNAGDKDYSATLLLAAFLGPLGIHRFYTGYIGIGLIQLFTFGFLGLWSLIDLIFILCNRYQDSKGKELANYNKTLVYVVIGVMSALVVFGGCSIFD